LPFSDQKPGKKADQEEGGHLALLGDRFSTCRQAGSNVSDTDQDRGSQTDFETKAQGCKEDGYVVTSSE
jgi:hypothetical protein